MLTHIRTSSWCELFCIWGYCTGDQGGFSVDPFMAMGIGPMLGRTQILSISAWNGNFIGKSHTLLIVETQNCVPLSFSSNGTCSLVAIRGKTKKKKKWKHRIVVTVKTKCLQPKSMDFFALGSLFVHICS